MCFKRKAPSKSWISKNSLFQLFVQKVHFQGLEDHAKARENLNKLLTWNRRGLLAHGSWTIFGGELLPHGSWTMFGGELLAHGSWRMFGGELLAHGSWAIFGGELLVHGSWTIFGGELLAHGSWAIFGELLVHGSWAISLKGFRFWSCKKEHYCMNENDKINEGYLNFNVNRIAYREMFCFHDFQLL